MRNRRLPDYSILTTVLVILAIGLIMVFSASSVEALWDFGDSLYFLKRQAVWGVLGLGAMFFLMNFDYWRLRPLARPILFAGVALLVLVLIPGVGEITNGARRWLGFGPLRFQPSEAAKLALVIYLAHFFAERKEHSRHFRRGILPFALLLGLFGGLVMLQPDLGTTIALAGTAVIMLFCSGAPIGYFVAMGALALPVVAMLIFGEEYRRQRFLSFLDPWKDPLGAGYHIIQGLYALGSGGIFGVGLTQSKQKYFYLPERHTDFIFAILGEELGFVGALLVIILFALFAWRGYRVALTAPDMMGSLLAVGVTTMVMVQVIINIGVVTSTMPITGITLPFISFGGSSLVFSLAGVGILLNVSRYCRSR